MFGLLEATGQGQEVRVPVPVFGPEAILASQ